jgi:hypothetical protein
MDWSAPAVAVTHIDRSLATYILSMHVTAPSRTIVTAMVLGLEMDREQVAGMWIEWRRGAAGSGRPRAGCRRARREHSER